MLYLFFDNKKLFSSFETYILIGFIFIISPVFLKHVKIYFPLIFMLFKYKSHTQINWTHTASNSTSLCILNNYIVSNWNILKINYTHQTSSFFFIIYLTPRHWRWGQHRASFTPDIINTAPDQRVVSHKKSIFS